MLLAQEKLREKVNLTEIELIQVAAVAIAFADSISRNELREPK